MPILIDTDIAIHLRDGDAAVTRRLDAGGEIIAGAGRHDRRRVLDRMIAAQAIVARLPLVTMNGRDFADVLGLDLRVWPSSA